ncbi:hypothetical protein MES5069_40125 [Mesorhizobium escarrei]|uniref:Uncharacterized protein n=1 Tax=Mesorhizobium escarrei TaxID=666018 RepID=A0ABN8K321_9HYPH|nr:hypothetical protein MES5069_40125 [Mesorhizobium escarrei]
MHRVTDAHTVGMASLQVGVAVQHQSVRVGYLLRHEEHNAVEQDQAGLLEQAAAKLLRFLDRDMQRDIGNAGQGPGRLMRQRNDLGALRLGDAGEACTDRRFPRAGDDQQRIAPAERWRRCLTDEMHRSAKMHKAHRTHLRDKAGASLPGKEPSLIRVIERLHQPCEGVGVDPAE